MPYIDKSRREKFNNLLIMIHNLSEIETKGDLEYLIFVLMKKFMSTREYRYSDLHDCVYACQHCSDEFRRRFLDKRENDARQKNGDI
jgi:hypothetical protein